MIPLVLDDAAVFPPGDLPLPEAVRAHREHLRASYSAMVGPLVVPASALPDLPRLVAETGAETIDVAVVTPDAEAAADVLARSYDGVRVVAVEISESGVGSENWWLGPEVSSARRGFHRLGGESPTVYVELPRDHHRDEVVTALAGTPYRAKLRTGGVRADLYPDESELAAAVVSLVRARVPFKATAGLHHAVRNTDPETGFEQHGFLNLLTATAAAESGADIDEVAALLAIRDPDLLPATPGTPATLLGSIGTCSITDPVEELTALGRLLEGVS